MPRKFGYKTLDLTLKEHHEGYHTLSKCKTTIGYTNLIVANKKGNTITNNPQMSNTLIARRKAKAMSIATNPGKQIFMNAFMLYMSGKTLNIFSISVTSTAILTPLKGLLSIESTFANLELDSPLPKLIFIACNLVWLSIGLYKMTSMRLLPTTSADWTESIVWKDMLETSTIPPPM